MSELEAALKIFGSIHDLITHHDDLLRASPELYGHVRTCFDMLYDYIGEGVLDLMSLRVVKLVEFHQLDVLILVVFIGVILSV